MRRLPVLRKTLRDQRWFVLGIGGLSALIAFFDIVVYPEYRDTLKDFQTDAFKGFIGEAGSIASPAGFLSAEFFSWIPLILMTLGIIGGTGAVAGEEAAGTLDLLLAQPIRRARFVLEKAAALTVAIVAAAAFSFPGFLAGRIFVDFPMSNLRIIEALAFMVPVTLVYTMLALWCSAAFAGRGTASLVTLGALVAAYFLNTLGAVVSMLDTPRKLSPFYWADASHILVGGFDWLRALGLTAVAAGFLMMALVALERRNVTAGGPEWSWRRLLGRPGGGQRAGEEPTNNARP